MVETGRYSKSPIRWGVKWVILLDKILKGLAVITVLTAIIAGFILVNQTESYESKIRWGITISWWISGAVSAIFFFCNWHDSGIPR